jgi:hypothetical protein
MPEQSGAAGPLAGSTQTGQALTEKDRADMLRLFGRPQLLPTAFWAYLVDYISVNQPAIPVSQIFGFTQFTAQAAPRVNSSEGTNSTSFTDLATVGPLLTLLPDGRYVFFFGAYVDGSPSPNAGLMGLKINATEATDNESNRWIAIGSGTTAVVATLAANGNNTVTCRYRSTNAASTPLWNYRWLIGLRFANT